MAHTSTNDRKITPKSRTRLWVVLAIVLGVGVLVFANAHLVYVAFTSAPDCVPHLKESGADTGGYRAAKSAC